MGETPYSRRRGLCISVVIPAYNEEKYLGRCLEALSRQSYPAVRFEVLVVDNGSSDRTAAIAHGFGARVIHEPRKGVARARQAGFDAAQGDIIASTDADTVVPPFWLSRMAAHFQADPNLGSVYGPVYWPDGQPLPRLVLRYPATWVLWASNRTGRTLWWGSNFAVRRDVFCTAGGFPVDWPSGEDTDLSLWVSRIAPIHYDPYLMVYASSRRSHEGWGRLMQRSTVNVLNRFLLGRPPVPMPDLR